MDRKKLTYTIISLLLAIFIWLMPSGWLGIEGLTVVEQRVTAVFVLAALFSTISEFTVSKSGIIIAILLLLFLIILSILFDGIAVATTSCDISLIMALAARKVPHTKQAILLVKNAGKVANVCADVIGDICGIISGACGSTIISQLLENSNEPRQMFYAIIMSSVIAALTVGGKGFVKKTAIKNSKEFVMVTARILSLIYKAKKK